MSQARQTVATVRLKLAVRLLTDLHAGSGLGGAGVDALVARDRRGNPVIRWSHLKGLLVEACRERAVACGQPIPSAMIGRLFGREDAAGQDRGVVQGRSLRMIRPGARPAQGIVWTSTAREEDDRGARDETMRRVEYVRAGTELGGELRLPGNNKDVELLRKLLSRLSHLGGQRSHGAGLVYIRVSEESIAAPPATLPAALSVNTGTAGWHCLRVLFQALEPVCLAATGQPGNLIPSHSHIAGTAVGGMLARWALGENLADLADALLDQRIACGPAYPLPASCFDTGNLAAVDAEVAPIPLSYQSPKPPGQDGLLPWWVQGAPPRKIIDALAASGERQDKLKRPGAHDYLYSTDGGERWQLFTCPIGTVLRNNTGTSLQCGSKQDLFEVEEIAEDTGFIARLWVRADALSHARAMLNDLQTNQRWLRVGRGGAPLVVACWGDITASGAAAAKAAAEVADTNSIRISVESDLILRATDFRFHTRLDTAALCALLADAGVDPGLLQKVRVGPPTSESVRIHGWNLATGHARLPALAIRRGSSVLLECDDAETVRVCRAALAGHGLPGLGERVLEGYGRLRIDFAPQLDKPTEVPEPLQPEDAEEQRRKDVKACMQASGFPADFRASRWQALRQLAGTERPLDDWFAQAERQIGTGDMAGNPGKCWLGELKLKRKDTALLRALGLAAAKQAQARETKMREEG